MPKLNNATPASELDASGASSFARPNKFTAAW
jgi:hypothetical protein